jgi:hypothetical protein
MCFLSLIVGLLFTRSVFCQSLSTRSFTNSELGSDPNAVTVNGNTIQIDLSALGEAEVYRATLDLYARPERYYDIHPDGQYPLSNATLTPYILTSPNGDTLELIPPRFLVFDLTEAAQNAVDEGNLDLSILSSGQGIGQTISVDIMTNTAAPAPIDQVQEAEARFENGSTLITFNEVEPYHTEDTWTRSGYLETIDEVLMHDIAPKRRYRIYRSLSPITSVEDIPEAEWIDEILPGSIWNYTSGDDAIYPYPIDHLELGNHQMGIYAHQFQGENPETAYYYISHTLNGAEDFSNLSPGGNLTEPVDESPGTGAVIEWKRDTVTDGWYFWADKNPILHYYVQWESPPYWNLPSRGLNYFVAEPHPDWAVELPSLEVGPHAWGGSYEGAHPWISYYDGGILLSQNLIYYNSYTAFHEYAGTLMPWSEGTVQPFFQARTSRFIKDFLVEEFNIDTNRVFIHGGSMGGAAGHLWGMRSGKFFSHILSEVGNNIPSEDPCCVWEFGYWGAFGDVSWDLPFSNEQMERFGHEVISPDMDISVWDYYDNTQWLANNIHTETPFISFTNSTDDPAIGWEQAFETAQVVRETKRPHAFFWGANGHNWPLGFVQVPTRLNESVPAFTNCSLDDFLGDNPDEATEGQWNRYLRWNILTDSEFEWEMELFLDSSSPENFCTVDVTPRRLQNFNVEPEGCYVWELRDGTELIDQGIASLSDNGLLTAEGVTVQSNALNLLIKPCPLSTHSQLNSRIEIFPNPTLRYLNIKADLEYTAEYSLTDLSGRLVERGLLLSNGSDVQRIDLNNLKSGMYLLTIENDQGVFSKKVVIE